MTVLVDRYELHELIGSGGMADVYAAVDRQLGRRVAIKLVRPDLVADGRSRQRLLREARAAASFHHPNSVAVFDVGEDQRQPFIVMELVDGESLQDRLAREGRLAPTEAARIGAGVLAAVEAAHERGLVHRDIKPGNVLLPRRGGVKLADFGIAKAVADTAGDLTTPGDVMGTPKYLAPEQVAGKPTEPASDLYSLGVVLYECLAGAPPFTGDSPVAVALAHQQRAVPPLRRAAPEVPAELARIVEGVLAKDPGDRFADAATMRRALEAVAEPAAADAGSPAARDGDSQAPTVALASEPSSPSASATAPAGRAATPASPPSTREPGTPQPTDAAGRQAAPGRPRRRVGVLALVVVVLAVVGLLSVVLLGPDLGGQGSAGDEPGGDAGQQEPGEPGSQDAGSGASQGDDGATDGGQDGDTSTGGSQDSGSGTSDGAGSDGAGGDQPATDQPADEPASGDAPSDGSATEQPAAPPTNPGAS